MARAENAGIDRGTQYKALQKEKPLVHMDQKGRDHQKN